MSHKRNQKTDEIELFLRIYPWTTKQDLDDAWLFIKEEQARYPDYIKRNEPWREFNRDHEIYIAYEKSKLNLKKTGKKAADMDVYADLHSKYPEISLASIRKSCERARKRLGIMDSLG